MNKYSHCNLYPHPITNLIKTDWVSSWDGHERAKTWYLEKPYFEDSSEELCRQNTYVNDLLGWAVVIHKDMALFITGVNKLPFRVNDQVSAFISSHGQNGCDMLSFILLNIKCELLGREWYELMPKFDSLVALMARNYAISPMTQQEAKTKYLPIQP